MQLNHERIQFDAKGFFVINNSTMIKVKGTKSLFSKKIVRSFYQESNIQMLLCFCFGLVSAVQRNSYIFDIFHSIFAKISCLLRSCRMPSKMGLIQMLEKCGILNNAITNYVKEDLLFIGLE